MCYGDAVLVAIHQRKLHLVPHKGDVEIIALGVLHIMVHLARFEQREDHKRGRGGDDPCQPAIVVSVLPRAIKSDLLQGQVWKQHRTPMGSWVRRSMASRPCMVSDNRPPSLTAEVAHSHRRAAENADSRQPPRDSHRDQRNSPHSHPNLSLEPA